MKTGQLDSDYNDSLKTIAKGGGIGLIGIITARGLAFIYQWALARTLGPELVGQIAIALSVIGLSITVVLFGMHRGVLKFISEYTGKGEQSHVTGSIKSSLLIFCFTALVVTPIIFFGAEVITTNIFNKPEITRTLRILALSIPFAALAQLLVTIIRSFKRIDYIFYIDQLISPLLKIIFTLGAIYLISRSTPSAAYGILISELVAASLATIVVWRLYNSSSTPGEKPVMVTRSLLIFSWPLLLTSIFDRANNESETFILGMFATSEQAGIYFVGLKITVFITVFLMALNVIFAPVIGELYAKNKQDQISNLYSTTTRWAFLLAFPIFLIIVILSPEVLMIFGPKYLIGVPVLRVLAISQLIFILTGPSGWILTMTGYPRLNLLNIVLTLIVAVLLDLWLVPLLGALGAAIGASVAIILVNTLRIIEVYKIIRCHPYNLNYLKPLVTGLIAGGVILAIRPLMLDSNYFIRLVILSIILFIIYVIGLLVFKLDSSDSMVIEAFQRRIVRIGALRKSH